MDVLAPGARQVLPSSWMHGLFSSMPAWSADLSFGALRREGVMVLLEEVAFKKRRYPHSEDRETILMTSPTFRALQSSQSVVSEADTLFLLGRLLQLSTVRIFILQLICGSKCPEENQRLSERSGFVGLCRDKTQCFTLLDRLHCVCSLFNKTIKQRPTNQIKV